MPAGSMVNQRVDEIERIVWNRLFHSATNLFYDYLSTYQQNERFRHLPTPDEIDAQKPNANGWGTGMEDSVISGGVMLACVCDKFEATGDTGLREQASRIFKGLTLCATISDEKGFLARSVCPADGCSYYPETSRDQITHFVHGLWRYYHSELATDEERITMRDLMIFLCNRLEKQVVPANNYHFARKDGTPGLVDKMWNVEPHEAARLPMCYAVAWDFTLDQHWYDLYERYIYEALKSSSAIRLDKYDWCYALFQHQTSMEVLVSMSKDDNELCTSWKKLMTDVAQTMPEFTTKFSLYQPVNVETIDMNWRTRPSRPAYIESGYGHVPEWPGEMLDHEFRPVRETGEGLLVQLMASDHHTPEEQVRLLGRMIVEVNYNQSFTCAMLYPLAAWWRFRKIH